MARYRVVVNGRNVLVAVDGRVQKHGFYTAVDADAQDADEAVQIATKAVLGSDKVKDVARNDSSDPPILEVEEVFEVDPAQSLELGFAWYTERRWWQFWKR